MALYDSKAPGVYIEEIPGGARPIQAVGTSTVGFVGKAPNAKRHVDRAVEINNWTQFVRQFVTEYDKDGNIVQENGRPKQFDIADNHLAQAVYGFFLNGGSRCYVANAGAAKSIKNALANLEPVDDIAIVAAPGSTDYADVLDHCERLKDRVAILDAAKAVAVQEGATPPNLDLLKETVSEAGAGQRPPTSSYGAFYFPWLRVENPLGNGERLSVPPSGHVAGVWARTDAERGVHKAPANERVRGAIGLTYALTDAQQGPLNQAGVNCIRYFSSDGILVWGARTLEPNGEFRYLNVRRLFNMVEESIQTSTRWIVFEPNDEPLWKSIRRDVGAFLTRIWRTGALMGATPQEAFFVKCDAETNPPENIDAGVVTTVIGIAPVKPAEFVVFQIQQYQAGADVAPGGGE